MTILTRIKNNQVTDNTIEYQKLKDGTLVGSKFNANLTLNSNVTILGNLTVANSFAQLNSINTYINDPIVVFNNNYTGSPTYDIGLLINRNLDSLAPYGAVNAAFVWKEADSAFEALMTTETGTTTGAINNSGWANVKLGNLTAVTANVTGSLNIVGATTFNTIEVTNLATFNGNTAHNNTVYITDTTASTSSSTGALVVTGGTGIGGNLNVYGNITTATGNIITTSSGIFYGNVDTGFGAIYAGIPSGYNVLPQTVAQFSANIDNYAQINFENINPGTDASTDYVATASEGGDTEHYINMGIAGKNWDGTQENSLTNALQGNDGYLYVQGNTALGQGGNLVVGASTPGPKTVGIIVGGNTAANITAVFRNTGTASTTSTTGAFTVLGGVGISQNLNVGGDAVVTGNLTVQGTTTTLNTSTLDVEDLNITVAKNSGSASAANGAGLTVEGASATLLYTFSTDSWNVNKQFIGLGAEFANTTPSVSTTTGALIVGGGVGIAGTVNAGDATFKSINNTPIGNTTPAAATFTTAVTTGVLTSAGNIVGNSTTASTSTTTGALVLTGTGGLGVGGKIYTGETITAGGNIVAASQTESTSSTTGALVVVGGAGIMANVFVGGASTFNSNMTAGYDTIIKGNNDETLLWARAGATYDQVLVGNSAVAANLVVGAKLIVNSTDSMIVPVGTNAQRPSSAGGTDVIGMFRYNSTVSALEVYDGDEWSQITTQFTVITSEQFNGDDVTTLFTLGGASSTAATIVSINGVIQIPTVAYSVTDDELTFTEAPATGDLIDVRRLATTSIVTGIASVNGYMQVQTDNNGVYIYTGTNSTLATTYWNPQGAEVSAGANISATTANVSTGVDSFFANTYRSAVYQAQVTSGTDYQVQTVTVLHNGTTATAVTHGVIQTNGNLGVFDANISAGRVYLNFVPSTANDVLRIKKDYILI
jgi:hypothetical protein